MEDEKKDRGRAKDETLQLAMRLRRRTRRQEEAEKRDGSRERWERYEETQEDLHSQKHNKNQRMRASKDRKYAWSSPLP